MLQYLHPFCQHFRRAGAASQLSLFTPDTCLGLRTLLKPLQQRTQQPVAVSAPSSGPCAIPPLAAVVDSAVLCLHPCGLLGWGFAWHGLTSSPPLPERRMFPSVQHALIKHLFCVDHCSRHWDTEFNEPLITPALEMLLENQGMMGVE